MILNSSPKPVIAVVDDDPRVLESLEDLLESSGYIVQSYTSAEALLEQDLFGWDALITDIAMPGLNGFALRDLVLEARRGVPIIMITGRDDLMEQVRTKGTGVYFRKPFDAQDLVAALGKSLPARG